MLGQRIKAARLEAGLSQRQLCGEVCTRNMLSLIESGKARPSMDTLRHFSRQLGKPLSWFLEEETMASPNQQLMEKVEKALETGSYIQGMSILQDYKAPDPVFDAARYFLETVFLLELADRAVKQEKLPYARELLNRVAQAGANTIYPWDRQRWLLLRFAAGEDARQLLPKLTGTEERLLLQARAALDAGDPDRAIACLEAVDRREEKWRLLSGQALMARGEYAAAADALRAVEDRYPAECLPALEVCYREQGNFELAYRYACRVREGK